MVTGNAEVSSFSSFYSFACGGWVQRAVIPITDRFMLLDKRNQNAIRKMLETPLDELETDSTSTIAKAKRFYKSCLNNTLEGEKVNLAHLMSLIDKTGGWHLTGKFHQEVSFDERVSIVATLNVIVNFIIKEVWFITGAKNSK